MKLLNFNLLNIFDICCNSCYNKGTSIYYKNFHEGALVCIQRGEKPSKIGFLEVPINLVEQVCSC